MMTKTYLSINWVNTTDLWQDSFQVEMRFLFHSQIYEDEETDLKYILVQTPFYRTILI